MDEAVANEIKTLETNLTEAQSILARLTSQVQQKGADAQGVILAVGTVQKFLATMESSLGSIKEMLG